LDTDQLQRSSFAGEAADLSFVLVDELDFELDDPVLVFDPEGEGFAMEARVYKRQFLFAHDLGARALIPDGIENGRTFQALAGGLQGERNGRQSADSGFPGAGYLTERDGGSGICGQAGRRARPAKSTASIAMRISRYMFSPRCETSRQGMPVSGYRDPAEGLLRRERNLQISTFGGMPK
jgi:hypothetical protein